MALSGDMLFNQDLIVEEMATEACGRVEGYFPRSSHGYSHFQQAGITSTEVPDTGLLVTGFGMSHSTSIIPNGPLSIAGYGAAVLPDEIPMVCRKGTSANNSRAVKSSRGSWTEKEDELLKRLVEVLGQSKWAVIARNLPGRVGKQCRERWRNHLNPHLEKNKMWTEKEEEKLIEAHKEVGNSWSKIARRLDGWSENNIKNHWNTTKRRVKSKRGIKKRNSEKAAPEQFSLFEEYVRNNNMANKNAAPPSQSSAPPSGLSYGGQAVAKRTVSSPPGMGMYLHPTPADGSSSQGGTMNLSSPLSELSAFYSGDMQERYQYSSSFPPNNNLLNYGQAEIFSQIFSGGEHLQDECMNLSLFPLPEGLGGGYYNGETARNNVDRNGDLDDIDFI